MFAPRLLLLHGALGSKNDYAALEPLLSGNANVTSLNFPGHGGTGFPAKEFSLKALTDFLDAEIGIEPAIIAGHSMGGYIALYSALRGNQQIKGILTLGTKWRWTPEIASKEIAMLNPATMEQKVPKYVQYLKSVHGETQWVELLNSVSGLLLELGNNNPLAPQNVTQTDIPVRILRGDRDQMVSLEETVHVYQALKQGSMGILPETPHPLSKVDPNRLKFEILEFLNRFQDA